MRWLINTNEQTSGPVDDAMVAALVKAGEVGAGSVFCQEGGAEWLPFEQTPFAFIARSAPAPVAPAVVAPTVIASEGTGGPGGRIFAAFVLGGISFGGGTFFYGFIPGVFAGLVGALIGLLAAGVKI